MSLEELRKDAEATERAERIRRGLPPDHLTDWAHYPFAFAHDAVRRFQEAGGVIPESVPETTSEQRSFPPVAGAYPTEPAIFFSCDGQYFQTFCLTLLTSVAAHSPGLRCHVHLIDAPAGAESLAANIPLHISFTREASGLDQADKQTRWNYYNAVRFIRFAEALEANAGPLWIADVDGLVTADVRKMLSTEAPLAMRVRAGRLLANEQLSACLALGTRRSLEYFRRVSKFLRSRPLHWGIDQLALFAAYSAAKPDLMLIGPDTASVDAHTSGAFWFTAGTRKLDLLKDDSLYAKEYRRVSQRYLTLRAKPPG